MSKIIRFSLEIIDYFCSVTILGFVFFSSLLKLRASLSLHSRVSFPPNSHLCKSRIFYCFLFNTAQTSFIYTRGYSLPRQLASHLSRPGLSLRNPKEGASLVGRFLSLGRSWGMFTVSWANLDRMRQFQHQNYWINSVLLLVLLPTSLIPYF